MNRNFWGRTKPPAGVPLDWGNPLTRKSVGFWLFNEGAGSRARDLSGRGSGLVSSAADAAIWAGSPFGRSWKFSGAAGSYASQPTSAVRDPAAADFTMAVLVQPGRNGLTECYLAILDAGLGNAVAIGQRGASLFGVEGFGTGSTPNLVSTVSPVIGRAYLLVFVRQGTTNTLWINGIPNVSNTATLQTFTPTTVFLNTLTPSFDYASANTIWAGVWARALLPSEIKTLWSTPFAMLQAPLWQRVSTRGHTYLATLAGGVTPVGVLVKQTRRALSGSTTPAGALAALRTRPVSMGGVVTPGPGTLVSQAKKILAGTITPVGALVKRIPRVLSGSVTPAGVTAVYRVTLKVFSGSVAIAGTLVQQIPRVLSGSTTPAGALAVVRSAFLAFAAEVPINGALTPTPHIVPIEPDGLWITTQAASSAPTVTIQTRS